MALTGLEAGFAGVLKAGDLGCLIGLQVSKKLRAWPPIYARKLQSLTDPKSSTPPVLFVVSLALHGATADNSDVVPRLRIVLIELHRLQVAGLQGSGSGGDDLAPFLQVDFQHPYKSN